jgi:hypothetical protein
MTAIEEIAAERRRQMEVEGWIPEHDDGHDKRELARAAACYAAGSMLVRESPSSSERGWGSWTIWPWHREWWKPGDHRRNLVKSGALIVAEIERLDRAS